MEEIQNTGINLTDLVIKCTIQENMLNQATDLNFSGMNLMEQPDLHELTFAIRLDLSRNNLKKLKKELFPPNIKELCLDQNKIRTLLHTDIPESVEVLRIVNNKLEHFDGTNFKNIKKMDMSVNVLETFIFPPNVTKVNISNNVINIIGDFPKDLIRLDCSDNRIINFPKINDKLIYIDMSNNEIREFPTFPDSVQHIIGKNNDIHEIWYIPENLIELDLDDNRIKEISMYTVQFPKTLKSLNLANNMIIHLPDLPFGVEEVYLQNNRLEEVPPNIPLSVKLLDVSDNCLENIPLELKKRNIKLKYSSNLIINSSDDELNTFYHSSHSDDDEFIRNMFNANTKRKSDNDSIYGSESIKSDFYNNFEEKKPDFDNKIYGYNPEQSNYSNLQNQKKYIYIVHKKRVTV